MERHFIAVNKVIIEEKLEMAFASPLALFLVSVSQLHPASPYYLKRSHDTREEGEENLVSFVSLHPSRLAHVL